MDIFSFMLSGNSTIITDSNTVDLVHATWTLAIATMIGIGITTIFTWYSLKETRKSNKLYRIELLERFRPVLEFVKFDPVHKMQDGSLVKAFVGELKNSGTVAINKIRFDYSYQNTKPENLKQILLNKDSCGRRGVTDDFGTIIPNSSIIIRTGEFAYNETEKNPLWFIAWIDYEFLENKEKCIFVLQINGQTVPKESVRFYSNSEIIKTEKMPRYGTGAPM